MGGKQYATLTEAFHAGFEMRGHHECWMWQKNVDEHHLYGRLCWNKQILLPHRVAWLLAVGWDPKGYVVRHRCDTPGCVNPNHLELGTKGDNAKDALARGQLSREQQRGTLQRGPNASHPPRRIA